MSEKGSDSKEFHKYCDNKGPTLVLIKTTKNKIFGGFTPLNWENKGEYIVDESNQTFIFSLNLMKSYDMIISKKKAIFCDDRGPTFGAGDILLSKNLKNGNSYANSQCNFLSNNNLELTGGFGENQSFETEEIEVFKVIY